MTGPQTPLSTHVSPLDAYRSLLQAYPSSLGAPRPPGEFRFPLRDIRRETPSVTTFRFDTQGSGFSYLPNQFVFLGLPGVQDPRGPFRPFSLSSSPTETDVLAITSKMTGSPFMDRLASLEEGEEALVRGPLGIFLLEPTRPAIMLAGGVGVTPFRGMIRYAADSKSTNPIVLLCSSKVPEEIVFRGELDDLAKAWGGLKVVHTITRPEESRTAWAGRTGRIDATLVREALDGLNNPVPYVCGTPTSVEAMVRLLRFEVGFPRESIRVERFKGY